MSSYPESDKTIVINGDYVLSIRGFLKIIESVSESRVIIKNGSKMCSGRGRSYAPAETSSIFMTNEHD